jgi:hypothetical protein
MTGGREEPIACGARFGGAAIALTGSLLAILFIAGCQATPARPAVAPSESLPGLTEAAYVPTVVATCPVPCGWVAQPLKANSRHTHQIWVSPSGATAYGVVHFMLPWPVGPDLALGGFISAMRKSEGDAQLVEQHPDSRGIAFVADGGRYHMRALLIVQGWEAWAIYSATLRGQPTAADELKLAELAVSHTEVRDAEPPIRQARAGEE